MFEKAHCFPSIDYICCLEVCMLIYAQVENRLIDYITLRKY